ncbi:hypothetical protein MO867_00285 [Microbulbifer sp. OS29]|uniref:Uncharacterized protein n=1 Tax=Microbulbifer okhotskensis TaxID=2926617 RepID=A0A9X2EIC8_9GAMM|nr:hypothetical protein [Microbulbifer okhotskensis]MCO1332762.1 hypothetical protein [Microbulbifer okhotskensis]
MKKIIVRLLMALSLCIHSVTAEEITTLESTVIGSQEQPKVLYIIPWKQANSLQRLDSVLPQTFSAVFQHQEYSEFRREIILQETQQNQSE